MTDKQITKRKTEISILNVLFCLMVLVIHTFSLGMVELEKTSCCYERLCTVETLLGGSVRLYLFKRGSSFF